MLLLVTNHMWGSPATLSHMTLNGIEGQIQGYADFEALSKGVELCHMLLLNINRKPCMGSPWCDYISL